MQDMEVIISSRVRVLVNGREPSTVEISLLGGRRRRWLMARAVALALIESARAPIRVSMLTQEFGRQCELDAETSSQLVERLMREGMLVSPTDSEHLGVAALVTQWQSRGWSEAADYHVSTFNYPFLDYASASESRTDAVLMKKYADAEPDLDRHKAILFSTSRLQCLSLSDALGRLPIEFGQRMAPLNGFLEAQTLQVILSASVGVRGTRPARYGRSAPVLLKVTPSGGGRHPTECYVIVRSVKNIPEGLYLFSGVENTLSLVPGTSSGPDWTELLARNSASDGAAAYVILTSRTARNRYRYREPRTFRTVFLDAGHIIGNLGLVCETVGISIAILDDFDIDGIERKMNLQMHEECVISALAVGSSEVMA